MIDDDVVIGTGHLFSHKNIVSHFEIGAKREMWGSLLQYELFSCIILAKSISEASSSAAASQLQTKPAPPTPIPEDANTASSVFQQSKGDATTTSSINPNTFAITGSRSSSVSEQPKEGKKWLLSKPSSYLVYTSCALLQSNHLVVMGLPLKQQLQCGGAVVSCTC